MCKKKKNGGEQIMETYWTTTATFSGTWYYTYL